MALPAGFLEELRARTPLPALIGRKVRLIRSGRHHKGCCPFHGEKTPSFYVYDDGFHCFGCGAHGDGISFVMQSEGVEFMDAVRRLAGEAGLEVPAPSPQAAAAERRRLDVHAVLACADGVFRRLLMGPEGARGLAYLRERALTADTIAQAGLGWAPGGRALLAALEAEGVTAAQAVEAGLAQDGEHGVRALFFERVVFPIRDPRGRVISFGGRTLGDGQPKYLNGPETAVFSKRRGLYGLDRARVAVRDGAALIVVEGYMDVLRLQQAGFGGAVAPLGTALTGEQLELLWRVSDAPILCFDGDAAGGRAAGRSLELALPLLGPERTLRVATLPAGDDPDSFVRTRGAAAMQAVLEAALPCVEALYDHMQQGGVGAGPEAKAAFRERLEQAARTLTHAGLAREYRSALLDRFYAARGGERGQGRALRRGGRVASPARPQRPTPLLPAAERGRILTAILLTHPDLLHDVDEAYGQVELTPALARLRAAMLGWGATHSHGESPQNHGAALDSSHLMTHLTQLGLAAEAAQALSAVPLPNCAAAGAQPAEAEAHWWHIFGLLDRGGLNLQVANATRAFAEAPSEASQRRLIALCAARDALRTGEADWGEAAGGSGGGSGAPDGVMPDGRIPDGTAPHEQAPHEQMNEVH